MRTMLLAGFGESQPGRSKGCAIHSLSCEMEMPKQELLDRLITAHPGWEEYEALICLVKSIPFQRVQIEYVGDFIASGTRLVFSALDANITWPQWLPSYVTALYGMKADDCEMEGGYSWRFSNTL